MTYDRDQLRRWSRPEDILRADEGSRIDEWLALFDAQLVIIIRDRSLVPADAPPTIVELFCARRNAEEIWGWDRATSSRRGDAEARALPTSLEGWERAFEESDVRHRMTNLALEAIDSTRTLARVAAGAAEVNVVAFDPARRRTG